MELEKLQQIERDASQILSDDPNLGPESLSALLALHHDERVLGEVLWSLRRLQPNLQTATAPIIALLGQARTGSYDVGDFQRLLNDLSQRAIAATSEVTWSHALESLVEKLGRETLLLDVGDLAPPIRRGLVFAMLRRGLLSTADVSDDDARTIARALIAGWQDTQVFARDWMATAPTPEVGRMFAAALAELPWSQPEPLNFAARYATAEETVRIALNIQDMELAARVLDMLDARRDEIFVLLNGQSIPLWDRAFGPDLKSWGIGAAGLIGPAGVVGLALAIGTYRLLGHLALPWFVLVAFVCALPVRVWVQRPARRRILATDIVAYRPAGAALLAAWYQRQRRLRKQKPDRAWDKRIAEGWDDDGEHWQHLLMGVEAEYVARPALPALSSGTEAVQDFEALEFGSIKEREEAAASLADRARRSQVPIPEILDQALCEPHTAERLIVRHLELSWLSRRRVSPLSFRQTWAQPPMWCASARCLFGVYNGYDELVRAFRIDESGELVDVNDDGFEIPGFHSIGLVHPDELTPAEANAWAEVFSDYQLISPFEQFRFESTSLPLNTISDVRGSLETIGWLGDEEGMSFRRPLYTLDMTIHIEIDPPCFEPADSRKIIALSFADGLQIEAPPALQLNRMTADLERLKAEWLHRLQRDIGL